MTIKELAGLLRHGKYTLSGCYPLFFVTADGAVLSFEAVRANFRQVAVATRDNDTRSGWCVVGADVNWEDPELYCDDTGERIESAYAEPEEA